MVGFTMGNNPPPNDVSQTHVGYLLVAYGLLGFWCTLALILLWFEIFPLFHLNRDNFRCWVVRASGLCNAGMAPCKRILHLGRPRS